MPSQRLIASMTSSNPDETFQPIKLTVAEEFEIERHSRLIDEISDAKTLQNMAKLLLKSWMMQKAASRWVIKQNCSPPPGR